MIPNQVPARAALAGEGWRRELRVCRGLAKVKGICDKEEV